ncbi:MAG: aminotransferase class III-fold pyridoxal phosphate-dependent enzyme [Candidatus Wildermuthbacteria bacterium]|nr:aminotransferase class III-fold pyridoxal phosphate-dependent enzyme [Candidatus Wildermuthbacteria bacterium]
MKTFSKSQAFFKKVRGVIPLASQTFSKSYLQYVPGQAPLFITHGKGAYVWDLDGNKYLDLINGLLPVVLGYQYKKVDDAIRAQLKKGITFSLPSPLEYELAKKLKQLIPCAEMARFGKNGSDATAGAVRLARAVTKRNRIAVCGYHGWQDWYIGANPRNAGVPKAVRNLVHRFEYNNLESLKLLFKKYPKEFAAVVMEPMTSEEPKDNFLQKVKALAHKHGALFVLDEIITGFRFSLGGAQKYFKVTPDLAAFGKSMANGMAISVVAGLEKYMKKMEDIFFSFTFGGECLSLAASLAVIEEMEKKRVIQYLWKQGAYLQNNTRNILKENGLGDFIQLKGKPCWQLFVMHDHKGFSALEMKSYIQKALIQRGILWAGSHNMSFSHTKNDIDYLLRAYKIVFADLKKALAKKTLRKELKGNIIPGNYSVRKLS